MTQRNIETGVDKLVEFINQKKKVSINEAANELGVGLPVIQEWADFLEDEGLITVEYKLSRTYLCERKLTKKEVEKKAKVYTFKKDAFTRKVESALSSLQRESEGFEKIKAEFSKLKDVIGSDIDQVREELQELKHYEDLKRNIDKDIIQQRLDYQDMINNIHRQIKDQKKSHETFLDDMNNEKEKIAEGRVELSYLEKREANLKKRVDALREIIRSLEDKIDEQRKIIKDSLKKVDSDLKQTDSVREQMKIKIVSELGPIIKAAKEKEEKVLAVQDSILKNIMEKKSKIDKYKFESTQASEKFKAFFSKKAKTQELIDAVAKDKIALEKELKELIQRAQSFNLSIKSSSVKEYIKDLQKKFKEIENKRTSFIKKLSLLADTITKKE